MLEFLTGPLDPADLDRVAAISADAFNGTVERAQKYWESVGQQNIRAVRARGEIAACLASLPCGQYFGGRPVPMAGIAAVAVAPQHRGRGVGAFLMRRELEQLFDAGVALSALYPATVPLYRNAGYEIAGSQFEQKLAIATIGLRDRELTPRRETPADAAAIEATYRESAAAADGSIERSEFFWRRVRVWQGEPTQGFVFDAAAGIEGYVFYLKRPPGQPPSGPGYYTISLVDFACRTPAAGRALLTFLADHFSQADYACWRGPPVDPLLLHLRECSARPALREYWMLRIVHVQAALEARGYPAGVRGEVHFDIRDNLLVGNPGRVVLEVADRRGVVKPGGRGEVRIDIRGLAALYTGQSTPHELKRCGYLDAADEPAALAGTLFASPAPWMRDSF